RGAELRVPLGAAAGERLPGRAGGQHPVTLLEHQAPLVLDELAVAPGVAVDLQVGAFGHPLRVIDRPVRPGVGDAAVGGDAAGRVGARRVVLDQLVFHAGEEDRATGVALAAGPPAQL